jgi:hypothetical protein
MMPIMMHRVFTAKAYYVTEDWSGIITLFDPFAKFVQPKMKTGKEPFKCGMASAECGVVEQQSNERTKFCRLGCLVPWLFKKLQDEMSRFNSDFRHRPASCVRPAPRCPGGIRNAEWHLKIRQDEQDLQDSGRRNHPDHPAILSQIPLP